MSKEEKIYQCKSCKETVEKNAKVCPHCGAKNPTITTAQNIFAALFLVAVFSIIIASCSDKKEPTNNLTQVSQSPEQSAVDAQIQSILSQAKDYEVLSSKDISNAVRSRWEAYIYSPQATTKEEQLATAAKAAMNIQSENRVQYSWVVLFDGRSSETRNKLIAINFAPDQKDRSGTPMGSRFKVE